ncbi:MAG: hypothetical protein R6V75_03905, partial [Bacteroidales bacterium]
FAHERKHAAITQTNQQALCFPQLLFALRAPTASLERAPSQFHSTKFDQIRVNSTSFFTAPMAPPAATIL